MRKFRYVFLVVLVVIFGMSACGGDDDSLNDEGSSLDQQEKANLLALREEEKLARDVYLYAYDKYGQAIFKNIADSEQAHMDSVLEILNTYNLEDPADAERGVFNNSDFQNLYETLTAKVDTSLIDALIVGNTIEDLDIKDIEEFKTQTDKTDILNMYNSLVCGSRNHLRNYYTQLQQQGGSYTQQYISQSDFDTIVSGETEQCG